MSEISISEATQNLSELLATLTPGEEVAVVQDGLRVATIRKEGDTNQACEAGSAKGKVLFMSEDFDAPLDDFAEYME